MRGDPVFYVRSSKDFEIVWKEKNAWKQITSGLGIVIVSAQTR